MTYSSKLRNPKWQKKRLEILNRDEFTCRLCTDKETTLNVHHLEYKGNPWDVPNTSLITLCEHCHEEVEFFKKKVKDFSFNKLFITKTIFESGTRTMFIIYDFKLAQHIYNSKNQYIIGLSFGKNSINNFNKLLERL